MIEEASGIDVSERAQRPALVEEFRIDGLFGYRDVSIAAAHSASVFIAGNGSGKTTLMAALDALLRRQFIRLSHLNFRTIFCRIEGVDEPIVIERRSIDEMLSTFDSLSLPHNIDRAGLSPLDFATFLERDVDQMNPRSFAFSSESKFLDDYIRKNGYRYKESLEGLKASRRSMYDQIPAIKEIFNTLSERLKDIEVVYLPTYRRVEMSLRGDDRRPRQRFSQPSASEFGLLYGPIQFGLSDILHRLRELNDELQTESSLNYRKISANIINDLLDGTFTQDSEEGSRIPDKSELALFFARLTEARRGGRVFVDATIPDLDRIYDERAVPEASQAFLKYFLEKLNVAIQSTRNTELMVENFISVCNKYLSNVDSEIDALSGGKALVDAKKLVLSRQDLKVTVHSASAPKRITFDSLSSGEKQMISFFASLYLYGKEKVILIDEPELSLSMEWQRKLLPDMLRSPSCRQVIAITHSPFIFDNEIEPFADAMNVTINQRDDAAEDFEEEIEIND